MITKVEAIAALREQAFQAITNKTTCGHAGCEDHPVYRPIVHCVGSFTGADWDLESAVALVEQAARIEWVSNWADHELAVEEVDGKRWHFSIRRPGERPSE